MFLPGRHWITVWTTVLLIAGISLAKSTDDPPDAVGGDSIIIEGEDGSLQDIDADLHFIPDSDEAFAITKWHRPRPISASQGHRFFELANTHLRQLIDQGRGEEPIRYGEWQAYYAGLEMDIKKQGIARNIDYDILYILLTGLDEFFSEEEGGYYECSLTFFTKVRESRYTSIGTARFNVAPGGFAVA